MTAITTARLTPDPQRFPPGTAVSAYRGSAWSSSDRSVPPTGAADAGPVAVAADGTLTFAGLTDQTTYFAWAAGTGMPVRFATRHDYADDLASGARGLATQLNFDPRSKDFDTGGMIWGAFNERMARFYAPWDGAILVDVAVLSAVPAGNLLGIVRDEGVAFSGFTYPHATAPGVGLRTRAWSNSVAFTATAKNWQSLGTPNIRVADASVPISAGVMVDATANAGAKLVGKIITDVGGWNLAAADLPHAGGTLPKLLYGAGGVGGNTFVAQDQISEGVASAGITTWPLIKLRWA
jgi:hypothetical protein